MQKAYRLKKNNDFQAVFKNGKSMANRQFVIYHLHKSGQTHFRLGLSVSKRIGNAVTRNHIKRLVREVFTSLQDQLKQDADYVVIARKPTAHMDYHQVESSLRHVLKKAKLLNTSSNKKEGD